MSELDSISEPTGTHAQDVVRHLTSAEAEWRRVGGVWAGQISTVRRQMGGAIEQLASEFSGIVAGLHRLVALAHELEGDEARISRASGDSDGHDREVVMELESSAARLEMEAMRIRANVESSLVHLQFQDRVDQILGHVETSVHALPDALAIVRHTYERTGKLDPLDFSPLLAAIEATFSTAEEHALSQGGEAEDGDELTFF